MIGKRIVWVYVLFSVVSCGFDGNKPLKKQYAKASQGELNWALWSTTQHPWIGDFEKIVVLLELGADIEYIEPDESIENTPFLNAAGAIAHAQDFIHKKRPSADIDSMESEAIRIVKYLAAQGANIYAVEPRRELNALHQAAIGGRARMIPVLVEMGLDINSADKNGRTPLLHAIGSGHLATVKAIVESGANINLTLPADGNSALDYALAYSNNRESQAFAYYSDFDKIAEYLEEIGTQHGKNSFEGDIYLENE